MKKISLAGSAIASSLLQEFYLPSKLNSNSAYEDYEKVAQNYFNSMPKENIEIIRNLHIYDEDYDFPEAMNFDDRFDVTLGMINLMVTILNVSEGYKPPFLNFTGLKRQIGPPYEPFFCKGEHQIKESNISYSLLFDR